MTAAVTEIHTATGFKKEEWHPKLYAPTRIKASSWIPCFWWVMPDPHAGEEGTVVYMEQAQYGGKTLYTVFFKKGAGSVYNYTEENLESPEPPAT